MQDAADEFLQFLKDVDLREPSIPIVSNVTGRLLTDFEARNPHYWAEHIVRTVDFVGSVETLRELGVRTFIEIGHGHSMSNLVRAGFGPMPDPELNIVQALGDVNDECESFADALALAWVKDPEVSIQEYATARRMVPLPTYPFERRVHWIEPVLGFGQRAATTAAELNTVSVLPSEADVDDGDTTPESVDVPAADFPALDAHDEMQEIRQIVEAIFESYLGGSGHDPALSFFDLGGNSLLAVQLINKLRETFRLDISVRGFYESSSVTGITEMVGSLLMEDLIDV
jgi:phthiocerol/phenolphthiocerol synthesis type-I polyketide synthase E